MCGVFFTLTASFAKEKVMTLNPASISVRDLFLELQGVEKRPFFAEEVFEERLFDECDDPWSPLKKLPFFFVDMLSDNPVKLTKDDKRNLFVERNKECVFACLQNVYNYIGPQAQIDDKSLRLRGGETPGL
jgi:hypothetical protein